MIFKDGMQDGYVHTLEWETPEPVTLRSIGAIGHHGAASGSDMFGRAFRSFKLLAWNEDSGKFEPFYSEGVPVPYGAGYCATMLFVFRNLETPVTARRFRAEFVQNDCGRAGLGPRVTQLSGFSQFLNLPMVAGAVHNPNPTFQFDVARVLDEMSRAQK
jgi:hypothetical protein